MYKPPEVSGSAFLNVPFEILIKQRDVKHVQGTAVHKKFFKEPARAVKLVGRVVIDHQHAARFIDVRACIMRNLIFEFFPELEQHRTVILGFIRIRSVVLPVERIDAYGIRTDKPHEGKPPCRRIIRNDDPRVVCGLCKMQVRIPLKIAPGEGKTNQIGGNQPFLQRGFREFHAHELQQDGASLTVPGRE